MSTEEPAPAASYRYPGSRPFQDTPLDRKLFWGREEEAHELLHLTLAERLVVVFANSGLGKTSLINAGLLEPLRQRDFFPMTARVNDPDHGPMHTLYRDIEEAVHSGGIELLTVPGGRLETEYKIACQGSDLAPGELSRRCLEKEVPLWLFFHEIEFWRGDVLCDPVLVIDQFEELFTLQTPEKREKFIAELASLVRDRMTRSAAVRLGPSQDDVQGPELKILLSLREDWLGSLEELAPKIPGVLSTRFRLGPLRREQAREAIERPATVDAEEGAEGFTYAPEAVEAILDFLSRRRLGGEMVSSDEVAPSQLQLICQYLEGLTRKPGHGRTITLDDLGGRRSKVPEVLSGVLEKHYDEQTTRVAEGSRLRAVRRLCENGLIVNGRRVSFDGTVITQSFGVTAAELRKLADCHLLRAVPRLDSVYYELAHDTLVQPILASRDRRRQRRIRSVSWALAAMLLIVATFGGWRTYAGYVENQRSAQRGTAEKILSESQNATAKFLARALTDAQRVDCLTTDEEESCKGIIELLDTAVKEAREIEGPQDVSVRNIELPKREEWTGPHAPEQLQNASRSIQVEPDSFEIHDIGGEKTNIPLPRAGLSSLALSTDGELIASGTGDDDGTLRLWRRQDVPKKPPLIPITPPLKAHDQGVEALAFEPGTHRVLSCGEDGLKLWDAGGKPSDHPALADENVPDLSLRALAWSIDGESIATGGRDGVVRVWRGGAWLRPFEGHAADVRGVAFDPSGDRVASVSDDGTLRVWDLTGKKDRQRYFAEGEDVALRAVAWSPDGAWITTGGSDKKVLWWSATDGTQLMLRHHEGAVLTVAFDATGRYLASGGRDGAARIWDAASGEQLAIRKNHKRYVTSVAFAGDGTAVSASYGASLRIASPPWEDPAVLEQELSQHDVTAVAMTRDGAFLASGGSDATVRLWKWNEDAYRRVITPLAGDWGRVEAMAIDPKNGRLAAATADDLFRVWDFDGKLILEFPSGQAHRGAGVEALDWVADEVLASRGKDDPVVRYWDVTIPDSPEKEKDVDNSSGETTTTATAAKVADMACRRLTSLTVSRSLSSELRDAVGEICAGPTAEPS